MQRLSVFTAIVLLAACDAAVDARAEVAPQPVIAAANVQAAAAGDVAVVADVEASAGAKVEIAADAFKLGEVTALVQAGKIESAADLELAINDPEADINHVDIDVDGKIDHVQVVEVRQDARVDFQLRVIPSSRSTVEHSVELATASVAAVKATREVSFSASFSAGVGFTGGASAHAEVYSFVAPARFEAGAVIVTQPLLAWAFVVERPVYASVFVDARTGRWVPPGHLKHGLWKATGGSPGDNGHRGGHGKFKGEAAFHGGGEGRGKHGGPEKHGGSSHGGSSHGGSSHGGSSKGGGKSSAPKHSSHSSSNSSSGGGGSKGGGPKGGGGKGKK